MSSGGDLARWADPAIVHSILGAEADSAAAFRPPPPELDDDDLRLLTDDDGISGSSLRDLGTAEVSPARMRKFRRRRSRRAVLVSTDLDDFGPPNEAQWLVRFVAGTLVLSVLIVAAIALFQWIS